MSSESLLKPVLIILSMLSSTFYSSLAMSSSPRTMFKLSTIAAEPAVLPYSPMSAPSPGLSPDTTPLFPTPASESSPDSSMPIIPSSPSPPNPDSLGTPHPEFGIAPSRAVMESSAFGLNFSVSLSSAMLVMVSFAFW